MTTGQKIKLLRERERMSQAELGERLGVKRAAINKYEKDTVNIPLKNIERLSGIFDVSPQYLVGWGDDQRFLNFETIISNGVTNVYGKYGMYILNSYANLDNTGKRKLLWHLKDLLALYSKN